MPPSPRVYSWATAAAAFALGATATHLVHRYFPSTPTPASPSSLPATALLAAVELGGTTCRAAVAFADDPTKLFDETEVPTTDPLTTISHILRFLRSHAPFVSLGVASFGPLDLDTNSNTYGFITTTPKRGWKHTDLLSYFSEFHVPIGFDTDVNAPAMAEFRYGNHPGDSCAYVTVGTGIGVGLVINGKPVHGLVHPEGGHIMALRKVGDVYSGWEDIHPMSVESMASARACAERTGVQMKDLASVSDSHPAWDDVAYYLAHLCLCICYIASPHVIVLSGGVMKRRILFKKIRNIFSSLNNGYISSEAVLNHLDTYIVPSAYANEIGIIGAIELARHAAIGSK